MRSLNGAEYDTDGVHPPSWRPPITPVTVDPLIHGEPLVPTTRPAHENDPLSLYGIVASSTANVSFIYPG